MELQNIAFANDFISLFLDQMIADLENSPTLKEDVQLTTDFYRALHPPKPTYSEFLNDNTRGEAWWRNRAMLLDFLSGGTPYNVKEVEAKVTPWKEVLIAEMIILYSRERNHEEVLKMLVHSLKDFDTAINYCLYGAISMFQRQRNMMPSSSSSSSSRAVEWIVELPREEQSKLFNLLLVEFLKIDEYETKMDQTGSLLDRFGGWLDPQHVSSASCSLRSTYHMQTLSMPLLYSASNTMTVDSLYKESLLFTFTNVADKMLANSKCYEKVLDSIPDNWSVQIISGFLTSALRKLARVKNAKKMELALHKSLNVKVCHF